MKKNISYEIEHFKTEDFLAQVSEINDQTYSLTANGNLINPVLKMGKHSTDELYKLDDDENSSEYYAIIDDLKFVCNNTNNLPVALEDKQLLVQLMQMFTKRNTYNSKDISLIDKNRVFDYPIESFAELIGYKYNETNRRNVTALLKKSINHLSSYRIETTAKAIKKAKNKEITIEEFGSIPILGGIAYKTVTTKDKTSDKQTVRVVKGCIKIALSMELAKYLNIAPLLFVPDEITTTKNAITFFLGYDFATHYNTNKSHNFSNANIRKVDSILEKCRDIPTYEDVKQNMSRKYFEKIIKPLCKGLSELKSFNCCFCEKRDEVYVPIESPLLDISNNKYDYFKGYLFENFKELYIRFFPVNYPILESKKTNQNSLKIDKKGM